MTGTVRAWGPDSPPPTGMAMQGDPGRATKLAQQLFDTAVLPSSLVPATDPPATLVPPVSWPGTPNSVDIHQAWTSSESLGSLTDFLLTHPPAGMTCSSPSELSTTHQVDGRATADTNAIDVTFKNTNVNPAGIARADLSYVVAPVSATTTAVRVDAMVIFLPPRSPSEDVPATDVVATVRRSGDTTDTVTVTDASVVHELAAALNGLPTLVPGIYNCPAGSVQYEVSFATAAGAAPNLVAGEDSGCGGLTITANGVRQTAILDGTSGTFIQLLEGLFSPSA